MKTRVAVLALSATLVWGCGESVGPTSATPTRLTASVTPSPLSAPSAPGSDLTWNVKLSAEGSGSILIERAEARLLDGAGIEVGRVDEYWSRSAGCSVCTTDVRVSEGSSASWSGKRIRYVGGGRPIRFVFTIFFVDDLGSGSTRTEVPVQ